MPYLSNSVDYIDECTQIADFIDKFLKKYLDEHTYVFVAGDFNFNCSAKHFVGHDESLILADLFGTNNLKICNLFGTNNL